MEKKAQRLVHRALTIVILLFLSISSAQDSIGKREILALNSIIDYSIGNSHLTGYIIEDPTILTEGSLKDYYEYRYEGKIKSKIILDIVNDSLVYDTDEKNEAHEKMFYSRYRVLDSYFSQSDLKKALEHGKQPKWKAKDFKRFQMLKSEKDALKIPNRNIFIYRLSRPFFSADGNFMGIHIQGSTAKFVFFTEYLLIYKLENDNWVKIERIITF